KVDFPDQINDMERLRAALDNLDRVIQPKLAQAIRKRTEAQERSRHAKEFLKSQAQLKIARGALIQPNKLETLQLELSTAAENVRTSEEVLTDPAFDTVRGDEQTRLIALLEAASLFAKTDICPVCDRPYPNLTSHIAEKVKRLSKSQSDLQA